MKHKSDSNNSSNSNKNNEARCVLRSFIKRALPLVREANKIENKKAQYQEKFNALCEKLRKYAGQFVIVDIFENESGFIERTQLIYNASRLSCPFYYETKSGEMRDGVFHASSSDVVYFADMLRPYNNPYVRGQIEALKDKKGYDTFDFIEVLVYACLSDRNIVHPVLYELPSQIYFLLPFDLLERAIDVCSTLAQLYVLCRKLEARFF
jgi:hypothetical protein